MKENEKLPEVFNSLPEDDQIIMINYGVYSKTFDLKSCVDHNKDFKILTKDEMQLTNRIIERTIFWMFCQRNPNLVL